MGSLSGLLASLGQRADAANPSGSVHAKLAQILLAMPSYGVTVVYGTTTVTQPATTADTTISTIDTSKSFVVPLGLSSDHTTNDSLGSEDMLDVSILNSTTIRVRRGGGGSYSAVCSWAVITISGLGIIKSLQDVTVSGADSTTSNTATISSVNTGKTLLINRSYLYQSGNVPSFGSHIGGQAYRSTLTNGTTITQTRNGSYLMHGDSVLTAVEFN